MMLFSTLASAAILPVFPLWAFATSVAEEFDGQAARLEKRLSHQAMDVRTVLVQETELGVAEQLTWSSLRTLSTRHQGLAFTPRMLASHSKHYPRVCGIQSDQSDLGRDRVRD